MEDIESAKIGHLKDIDRPICKKRTLSKGMKKESTLSIHHANENNLHITHVLYFKVFTKKCQKFLCTEHGKHGKTKWYNCNIANRLLFFFMNLHIEA